VIRIFEMFSGYGGASFALKKAKLKHKCVGFSEIDKDAIKCYNTNFPNIKNYGDCNFINPEILPDFDLLTAGFPCQPFSEAGKHGGTQDTRGTLFYDIIRIAEVKQPDVMVLENVKGLTFNNHRKTFRTILDEIDRIGFFVEWKIMNSKNQGTPQSRERVVFICINKRLSKKSISFPPEVKLDRFLKDIINPDSDFKKLSFENSWGKPFVRDVYPNKFEMDDPVNTIISVAVRNKNRAKHQHHKVPYGSFPVEFHLRFNKDYGVSYAVKSAKHEYMICDSNLNNIRYLSGKEAFRLMGFFNDEIDLSSMSTTAQFKLAGNGWDINLFSQVFKHIYNNLLR